MLVPPFDLQRIPHHGKADDREAGLWESRLGRPLDPEAKRTIRQNLAGFFGVLLDWRRRSR
jgi:hypothetical protein